MATLVRRNSLLFLALLALVPAGFLPGCDWLSGSESAERKSPFISDLRISSSSVFCDEEFTLAFNYDDLQGDIARVTITRRLKDETTSTEETEAWPDDINQNMGGVSFPLSFACDSDSPGGQYEIRVWAEDDGGHKSNELSEDIYLNKAG